MPIQERFDFSERSNKCVSQFRVWSVPDYNQERNAVTLYRRKLVRLVAYVTVMIDGDPPTPGDCLQPILIRTIRREMIGVSFNFDSGIGKNRGKSLAEITIGEEGMAQAARS